ncbi:MAG TPA: hypothetical protein VL853_09235, partial [Gemmatimonadales bacterium]|nr:hypothetical protein [Gemmatimonadales bacterium]
PVEGSKQFVDAKVKEYLEQHYHQPGDQWGTLKPLNLEGSKQFAEYVREVTIAVANEAQPPSWVAGGEFKREARSSSRKCAR